MYFYDLIDPLFILLNNIPVSGYTIAHVSSYLLEDILITSSFGNMNKAL